MKLIGQLHSVDARHTHVGNDGVKALAVGRRGGYQQQPHTKSAGAGQHVVRVKDGEDFCCTPGQAGAQQAAPLQRI